MPIEKLHLGIYAKLTKDGKTLLIKKIRGPYKDMFDLPGGRMEHGEDVVSALKREVMEETGVIVKSARLLDVFTHQAVYTYEGKTIDMHQVGIICEVTEFDDSGLIEEMEDLDSGGAIWKAQDEEMSLSPFAEKIMR